MKDHERRTHRLESPQPDPGGHTPSRRLVLRAILGILMLGLSVPMTGRTLVVSPQGFDTAPGTLSFPWRTLTRANAAVQPGDTVLVREGTYHERILPARSGQPGAPIVYLAAPGETVVVDGTPDDLIVVYVGSHTVIEGLTIKSQAASRVLGITENWVHLIGDQIILRRCRIIADGDPKTNYWNLGRLSRGVLVEGTYVTIEHCFIRGQQMGVELAGDAPRFFVMRFDTLLSHGASNFVISSPHGSERVDTTMQRNLIEYCIMDTSWEEDNIQFEGNYVDPSIPSNRGTIIRNCRLGNAAENAVDLKGAMYVLLDNNLMYSAQGDDDGLRDGGDDSGWAGIQVGAGSTTRYVIARRNVLWDNHTGAHMYDGYHYYNNTFLNNRRSFRGPNGQQASVDFAGMATWTMGGFRRAFINNVVGNQPNKGVLSWLMDYGAKFHINGNLYFETGNQPRFYHRVSGNLLTTVGLSDWQSILSSYSGYAYLGGKDKESIEADPRFVNVPQFPVGYDPSWDFGLQSGSPAIDAGQAVTVALQGETESTRLLVDDPYFFCDGFGITDGDSIRIGNTPPVQVRAIDYENGVIEIGEPRTWGPGDGVHLAYNGLAPDIGVAEHIGQVANPLGTPQLLVPASGAANLTSDVLFTWSRVQDATTYDIQVSRFATLSSPVVNSVGRTDTAFLAQGLAGGTTHFWRVRSSNGSTVSAWSSVRSFSTASKDSALSPPSASSPADGARGVSTNPAISWLPLPSATSYHVQVSDGFTFSSILLDMPDLTETLLPLDGLKGGTTYYWRINASTPTSTSRWSDPIMFTTFTFPESYSPNAVGNPMFANGTAGWSFYTNGSGNFSIGSPGFRKASSAKIFISKGGTNVQLYQTGLVLSPDSTYRLRFAASSNSGNDMNVSLRKHVAPYTSYGVESYRVDLTPLWKVYSIDFKPEGTSTAVNDVRLAFEFARYAVTGDVFSLDYLKLTPINALHPPPPDDVPADYYLDRNFPNPFNPTTTIRYGLPADVHVVFRVYNILGQEVITPVNGFQSAGVYELRLDMRGHASGMYLYTLQAGEYRQTHKMMYVK